MTTEKRYENMIALNGFRGLLSSHILVGFSNFLISMIFYVSIFRLTIIFGYGHLGK